MNYFHNFFQNLIFTLNFILFTQTIQMLSVTILLPSLTICIDKDYIIYMTVYLHL